MRLAVSDNNLAVMDIILAMNGNILTTLAYYTVCNPNTPGNEETRRNLCIYSWELLSHT